MGFDDVSTSALINPPLTTMAVPKNNMGALAVRRLVDLIQGNTGGETVRISVQPEIVQRKSVAPPAGGVGARGHTSAGRGPPFAIRRSRSAVRDPPFFSPARPLPINAQNPYMRVKSDLLI